MKKVEIPEVLYEMPGLYYPDSYAIMNSCPVSGPFLVKLVARSSDYHLWVEMYKDGQKVWDCNPNFFRAWFKQL